MFGVLRVKLAVLRFKDVQALIAHFIRERHKIFTYKSH